MQTNITHYEDMMQLEDDKLCFLPTVSDIDVFGCEVDLIDFATQLPLPAAALMQQRKLQIVVRPCMVEGHSNWQFLLSLKFGRWSFSRLLCPSRSGGPRLCPVHSKSVCGVLLSQQNRC